MERRKPSSLWRSRAHGQKASQTPCSDSTPVPPEPGFPWPEDEGAGLKGRPTGTAVTTGEARSLLSGEGFRKSWGSTCWRH